MTSSDNRYDVILVGGGIMSATLATILKLVEPGWSIRILERLAEPAVESSNPWNNAGTGHSALCELNYTPKLPDGSVDISKAIVINEQFQVSRQFWASLVSSGIIADPGSFINQVPHMSFVRGEDSIDYLRKRQAALVENPLFADMEFTTDRKTIADWTPLIMNGRDSQEKVAATRYEGGTDVDFGALTKAQLSYVKAQGAEISYNTHVTSIGRLPGKTDWSVSIRSQHDGSAEDLRAKFVFIGAGGGALKLLQKSGIPEAKGFAGFPISGQFFRCTNQEVIKQHHAKVYGQAAVGAPPMSVPHLDTRVIDGKQSLMFGPYAGFSTKFLKKGGFMDLPGSIKPDNLIPMLAVGKDNLDLVTYLVKEIMANRAKRVASLQEYFPEANGDDWELIVAGQRVQVIKKAKGKGGVLQFGTEVVSAEDGSIAGLLGASPGASTAVPIMLTLISRCFTEQLPGWEQKLAELIPSYGKSIATDAKLAKQVMSDTARTLNI